MFHSLSQLRSKTQQPGSEVGDGPAMTSARPEPQLSKKRRIATRADTVLEGPRAQDDVIANTSHERRFGVVIPSMQSSISVSELLRIIGRGVAAGVRLINISTNVTGGVTVTIEASSYAASKEILRELQTAKLPAKLVT